MARCVADCALIDGIVTGDSTEVAAARRDGLRIGVPRGHFWGDLDREVERILEPVLAQLRNAARCWSRAMSRMWERSIVLPAFRSRSTSS
jgi:hypothetical protein